MRTQEKILGFIITLISSKGFEVCHNTRYSNAGSLSIERYNRFGRLAEVTYNFEDTEIYFKLYLGGKIVLPNSNNPNMSAFKIDYSDVEAFTRFQRELERLLDALKP